MHSFILLQQLPCKALYDRVNEQSRQQNPAQEAHTADALGYLHSRALPVTYRAS